MSLRRGSNIETQDREARQALKRIEDEELKRDRYDIEDKTINQDIVTGKITEDEAKRRFARMAMQKQKGPVDVVSAAGADYQTTQQMLEELLDDRSKVYAVRVFKEVTGFRRLEIAASRERLRRRSPKFRHPCPLLRLLAQSNVFELGLGVVMLVNGVTIGVTTDLSEEEASGGVWFALEHFFTLIFTFEIGLRIGVEGWPWLMDAGNFADASLVFLTGILPVWILAPFDVQNDVMRAFQVLRVLRLTRLVRIVRTVPIFRIFWTLIQGLLDSGRTLLWTYVMIGTMIFIFGTCGVLWIGRADNFADDEFAQEYFGNLYRAAITLFQTATFDSWTFVARPLMENSSFVAPFFLAFVLVVPLALLNLVTAVIVNNAFQNAEKDDEMRAKMAAEKTTKEIASLRQLFIDIDTDGSGMLDHDEYVQAVEHDEGVMEKFELLEITPQESEEIWQLLDIGSGELSVDMFANGLQSLMGEAKAKDSFTIVRRVQRLNARVQGILSFLEQHQDEAEELRAEVATAHRSMGAVVLLLGEFAEHMARLVPAGSAPTPAHRLAGLRGAVEARARDALALAAQQHQSSTPSSPERQADR